MVSKTTIKALEDPKMDNEGQTTYRVVYDDSRPTERLSALELKESYGDSVFQSMRFWYDLSPSQAWMQEVMAAPHPSDEQFLADQSHNSEDQASLPRDQEEQDALTAKNPLSQETLPQYQMKKQFRLLLLKICQFHRFNPTPLLL